MGVNLSENTAGTAQERTNGYVVAKTATATLAVADVPLAAQNVVYTMSNAGATTLTFPPNSTAAYPIGFIMDFASIGAGTCTLTAGSGVTLAGGAVAVATTVGVRVAKTAINTWTVLR